MHVTEEVPERKQRREEQHPVIDSLRDIHHGVPENFYQKYRKLKKEESVLVNLLDLCQGLDWIVINPVSIEDAESMGDILIQIDNIRSREL